MSFCSDTLNARDHFPGTTILVPSVQFFTCTFYWQLNSRHQSGASSTYVSEQKPDKRGINSDFTTQINQQIIMKM